MSLKLASLAAATLSIPISTTADTILIAGADPGWPSLTGNASAADVSDAARTAGTAGDYFHAVIREGDADPEIVRVWQISNSGRTLSVIRGQDGTAAGNWSVAATITLVTIAEDFGILQREIIGLYRGGVGGRLGSGEAKLTEVRAVSLHGDNLKVGAQLPATILPAGGAVAERTFYLPNESEGNEEDDTIVTAVALSNLATRQAVRGGLSARQWSFNATAAQTPNGAAVPPALVYPVAGGSNGDVVHIRQYDSGGVVLWAERLAHFNFLNGTNVAVSAGWSAGVVNYSAGSPAANHQINIGAVSIRGGDDSGWVASFAQPASVSTAEQWREIMRAATVGVVGYQTGGVIYADRIETGVVAHDGYARLLPITSASAPTANDDSTRGITVGQRWITTAGVEYRCTDATADNAIWRQIGNIYEIWTGDEDSGSHSINTGFSFSEFSFLFFSFSELQSDGGYTENENGDYDQPYDGIDSTTINTFITMIFQEFDERGAVSIATGQRETRSRNAGTHQGVPVVFSSTYTPTGSYITTISRSDETTFSISGAGGSPHLLKIKGVIY